LRPDYSRSYDDILNSDCPLKASRFMLALYLPRSDFLQSTKLRSFLLQHLDVDHHAVAITDGSSRLTWAELDQQICARVGWLTANVFGEKDSGQGACKPGDRVGLLMQNQSDYIPCVLAAVSAGLWVVPINWHLTTAEQRYIVEDSGMRQLLCPSEYLDRDLGCQCIAVSAPAVAGEGLAQAVGAASPAGGIMLYTSGTTGKPKGVQRRSPKTLGELKSQWLNVAAGIGLNGGVHLITGPLYHAAPLLFALYDLLNGAALVVMPKFDAESALRLIDQFGVSHSHWVPTMFVRALRLPESERASFSGRSMTLVLHGAAPVAPAVKRSVIDWWGPVLVEYWGGSESGAVSRCSSEEWLARPGNVGKVLPQYEVVATHEGKILGEGEIGLLGIRPRSGDQAFSYWQDAEKTSKAYIRGAMFQLGDIGYVKDNYVYLLDRESHTVISGGVNLYPAEIEASLLEQTVILDVVVLGVPDEEWGERLIAVVEVVDAGRDLLAEAAILLASYKLPRELHFGAVERNAAGKVPLATLRARYGLATQV
jgi:long-chain acyl-CoA synthetase